MKRAGGFLLLAALAAHAWTKPPALLPEMLWTCHLATALLGIGLIFNLPRAIATGFLIHLAVGLPTWLLDTCLGSGTTMTGIMVHVLPPLFGALACRKSGMPRGIPYLALSIGIAAQLASRFLTPPELNVNAAFTVWPPLQRAFPSHLVYVVLSDLLDLALLVAADFALSRLWGRPGAKEVALA